MIGRRPVDPGLDYITAATLTVSRADADGDGFAAVQDWFVRNRTVKQFTELTGWVPGCQHMDVRIFAIAGRDVIRRDELRDVLAAQRWRSPGLVLLVLSTWDERTVVFRSK